MFFFYFKVKNDKKKFNGEFYQILLLESKTII
jgi:hypothetical protein